MSQGKIGCCTPNQLTILVLLFSTIVLSGFAGPGFSLDTRDVMDHTYFGGQMRGDTVPLSDCNPAHDPHYLNCVMTLTDAEAARSILARHALEELAEGYHHGTAASPVYFKPRDISLHKAAIERRNAGASELSDVILENAEGRLMSFGW